MKYFIYLAFSVLLLSGAHSYSQQAQPAPRTAGTVNKKLNLDDINVKGELLSDDRMNFVRRQREELKNRIKFRTNFRSEILQEYKK